ncbi:hypothetical protein, partial [Mycobacterium sp.]|uniref:hypothetical protein n=1 Tax=Mycobacterium sp. TaxID=1785 RepID=UPI002C1AE879
GIMVDFLHLDLPTIHGAPVIHRLLLRSGHASGTSVSRQEARPDDKVRTPVVAGDQGDVRDYKRRSPAIA